MTSLKKQRSPLKYLNDELTLPHSKFIAEWARLSDSDKSDLKQWAQEEMDLLEKENS